MTEPIDLVKEINALLGSGTLQLGSDENLVVKYLPTGVLPIDHLLGGGLPRNRVTEFFGNYSTLKSYIGLRAIATTQASGGMCALVDTEHAYDPDFARSLGVDHNRLLYLAPETGEEAVDAMETLIRQELDLIVWDSIAATLPQTEQAKRMHKESMQPARLAALMSAALRKLTSANKQTALLFINQTRVNVGVMFGSPESVPGGKALPFYASYRVALRKAGQVKETIKVHDGEKMVNAYQTNAIKIKATLEKSKLSAPHRETWFLFDLTNAGIDETGYLISLGLEKGIIHQKGASWEYKETKVRGAAKFRSGLTSETIESLKKDLGLLDYGSEEQKRLTTSGANAQGKRTATRRKRK